MDAVRELPTAEDSPRKTTFQCSLGVPAGVTVTATFQCSLGVPAGVTVTATFQCSLGVPAGVTVT